MRELLASHSVNTAPLATIEAYIRTDAGAPKLPIDDDILNGYFTKLADNGFSMDEIYQELLEDGLQAFEQAFQEMLDTLK
jgi:transaldolase